MMALVMLAKSSYITTVDDASRATSVPVLPPIEKPTFIFASLTVTATIFPASWSRATSFCLSGGARPSEDLEVEDSPPQFLIARDPKPCALHADVAPVLGQNTALLLNGHGR